MAKVWQRPKAKCPHCGFNLGGVAKGMENKMFRSAERKMSGTYRCPSCSVALVPVP